jgi:hypothetical protein
MSLPLHSNLEPICVPVTGNPYLDGAKPYPGHGAGSPDQMLDQAHLIEAVWGEWADQVVIEAATETVAAIRRLVDVIRSDRD